MQIIIRDNDIYFIKLIDDKIVVNNNYRGINIYNLQLEKVKEINLFEGICIYNAFCSNKEMILFCPDNEKIVYINLEDDEVKIIKIPRALESEILKEIIWQQEDKMYFLTYKNNCICLDKSKFKISKQKSNSVLNRRILKCTSHDINNDSVNVCEKCYKKEENEIIVYTYEQKILLYNGDVKREIVPQKGYIFRECKILNDCNNSKLIILSNNKYDEELSIIEIVSI